MTKALYLLSTVALLMAPLAHAQESDQTAPETPEQRAPAQLDTGEVVTEAPANAGRNDRTYVRETNGEWALQCLKPAGDSPEAETDPCQMYQLLQDSQDNSVAEVSIFRLQNGGQVVAGGTFVVPLETLLTERLTIQVDSGQAKRYDYSFCTQIGCYARVGFTNEDISRFKAGAVAKITLVPALAPAQKVTVEMSLAGITASFDKVTPIQTPN